MTFEEFLDNNKDIPGKVAYRYRNKGIENDDLKQIARLGMYKAYQSLDGIENQGGFAYKLACQMVINELRSMNTLKRRADVDSLEKEDRFGRKIGSILESKSNNDTHEFSMIASEAIKKLPDKHKQVLRMVMEGYTNDEMFEVLGYSSKKSLCTVINRIKKQLYAEFYPEVKWNDSPYFNNKRFGRVRS